MLVLLHMTIDPLCLSLFYCFLFSFFLFPTREEAAIRELLTLTKDTRAGGPAEGAHLHIVHLSDASSSLDLIKVLYVFFFTRMNMQYLTAYVILSSHNIQLIVETCVIYNF